MRWSSPRSQRKSVRVAVIGAGFSGIAARRRPAAAGHHGLHDLRQRPGRRRDLVAQPVSRRGGGSRVAHLLVLVRAGGLEPQLRPPPRTARLPGERRRRFRPPPSPGAGRECGEPHLDGGPRRVRDHDKLRRCVRPLPGRDQRRRVPERPAHPVADPRGEGVRRGDLPYRPVARAASTWPASGWACWAPAPRPCRWSRRPPSAPPRSRSSSASRTGCCRRAAATSARPSAG